MLDDRIGKDFLRDARRAGGNGYVGGCTEGSWGWNIGPEKKEQSTEMI